MLVMVADITSAIGSEKKAASAVNRAGSSRSPGEKTHLRNAEQKWCLADFSKRGGLIYQRILDRQRNDHGSEPFDIGDGSCKDHGISGKQSYIERRNSLRYDCHKDAKITHSPVIH